MSLKWKYKYKIVARNVDLGQKAVEELAKEGINVKFHQLDIDDQSSIDRFAKFILDTYGGLDILVNNAAIAYKVLFFQYRLNFYTQF